MVIWVIKTLFCIVFLSSCPVFLIFSASLRSFPFLFIIAHNFAWNVTLVSPVFLKRSPVFLILLFSYLSLNCSLKKTFLCLLAILWNSAFNWVYLFLSPLPFFSQLFVRLRQPLCLLAFLFLGFGHHLLYNFMNLCPLFLRHSVYQI